MYKQETQIIKGIAILMMLVLHLFNNGSANQLQHLLWIDNQPFLQILTRAANPIFFFCFCGGYGLYYTYQRGKDSHHYRWISSGHVMCWELPCFCMELRDTPFRGMVVYTFIIIHLSISLFYT